MKREEKRWENVEKKSKQGEIIFHLNEHSLQKVFHFFLKKENDQKKFFSFSRKS